MVEEACSGIHSLFSCLCAVIFVCVIRKSGFLRIVINAVQTTGWVIAANAVRVFLVIYAFSEWDLPLDKGFDGLVLAPNAETPPRFLIVLGEDKATEHPRDEVHDSVWPSFKTWDAGDRDTEIQAVLPALLPALWPKKYR